MTTTFNSLHLTDDLFEEKLKPLFSFHLYPECVTDYTRGSNDNFANFMECLERGTMDSPPLPFSLAIGILFGEAMYDEEDWPYLYDLLSEPNNTVACSLVQLNIRLNG